MNLEIRAMSNFWLNISLTLNAAFVIWGVMIYIQHLKQIRADKEFDQKIWLLEQGKKK